ncbi:Uncharacterised protein [Mycobacteroides abscessus subsp. massiliense]|nr:Uncharacterised protein [Mycobacteroides abscessus subsp. massiliense]SKH91897.1 Uncharacterised protein [Mycobacteroides abscessus subsp. massiliense]SKI12527.1 Uncharacterised protein [Mycobacteroides abscessus subsp. massiliense]SKK31113.1 Uncharacterised protein [Mycobacteroides abscessus subsp. massiliense]SKK39305.1 Uncharacterised protein [Mycobacteroides abscessus subsp. massiliense]
MLTLQGDSATRLHNLVRQERGEGYGPSLRMWKRVQSKYSLPFHRFSS